MENMEKLVAQMKVESVDIEHSGIGDWKQKIVFGFKGQVFELQFSTNAMLTFELELVMNGVAVHEGFELLLPLWRALRSKQTRCNLDAHSKRADEVRGQFKKLLSDLK